jgi:hypothetical protein
MGSPGDAAINAKLTIEIPSSVGKIKIKRLIA